MRQNSNQNSFYDIFLDLLRDVFDAENQLVAALPKMAQAAHHAELKDAFSQHLEETKNQVQRLKKVFKDLNENPTGKTCRAMQGLIEEGEEIINRTGLSPSVKDAALIIAGQKVEHYEIASYGSARSLALQLNEIESRQNVDFNEVADILQTSLDEEGNANDLLTSIAEGGIFTTGINQEAVNEEEMRNR
jgi:ferritin-like metal-binding protein YciE